MWFLPEFLRRFLLHVLPRRFVRIRYFGFLALRCRTVQLPQCRRALAGAAVGAAAGGLTGALVGLGIPEYEAKRYEGRVKDGGVLLSVHCDTSDDIARAKDLLKQTGAGLEWKKILNPLSSNAAAVDGPTFTAPVTTATRPASTAIAVAAAAAAAAAADDDAHRVLLKDIEAFKEKLLAAHRAAKPKSKVVQTAPPRVGCSTPTKEMSLVSGATSWLG